MAVYWRVKKMLGGSVTALLGLTSGGEAKRGCVTHRESLAALEVDGLAAARERGGERGLDGVEAGE